MHHRNKPVINACLFTLGLLLAGCGGDGAKKDPAFFTSGNREADQRASQRMAKAEQLQGSGEQSGDKGAKAPEKISLFDRLGGQPGLQKIVDDFTTRALADPRVNWQRKGMTKGGLNPLHRSDSIEWSATPANVEMLKKHIVQFLALATGGPAKYDGRDMKSSHQGMKISNPEFEATLGDLKATLDKFQIPNQEQKELLAIVESTREQIVENR